MVNKIFIKLSVLRLTTLVFLIAITYAVMLVSNSEFGRNLENYLIAFFFCVAFWFCYFFGSEQTKRDGEDS